MTETLTATREELKAELAQVNEAGIEASFLFAALDPFTKTGREVESEMTKLRLRRMAIITALRAL